MRIINATLALAILACGAPAEDAPDVAYLAGTPEHLAHIDVPGQEGRMDGSVWSDGIFRTEEARTSFCSENGDLPEAWFCSELGTSRQAWTSAEYHGMRYGGSGACYGPAATNGSGDCLFPEMKHIRIVRANTDCFTGPPPGPPSYGPTVLQEQALIDGIVEGAKLWDNAGAAYGTAVDIVDSGTPGKEWYAPVNVTCQGPNYDATAYAVGGITANAGSPRIANLPVGPHSGKDQDDGRVGKNLLMAVHIWNLWRDAIAACPGEADTITPANLKNFARSVGTHEMGHALGFAHFNLGPNMANNVMYPFRSNNVCNEGTFINQQYHEAIGIFDTPASGGSGVVDRSLWVNQPQ